MERADFYELDIVDVAFEIAEQIPGVTSVSLFGSRKFPGKVRSDLDLLVEGPSSMSLLLEFRQRLQHYKPLDLWLALGEYAASAVNGSALPTRALRKFELYPDWSALPIDLRKQRFRTDIDYTMTVIPPGTYVPMRGDHLGVADRCPQLLDSRLDNAAEAVVRIISNSIEAIRHMRHDGHARRGEGTQIEIRTEYDVQNLIEVVLSPLIGLEREAFTVECQGVSRKADFSFAGGRLILELKMVKSTSELSSDIKDAKGGLSCYLDHPGTEIALAVLAVTPVTQVDKNSIEAWSEVRGNRRAMMRVISLPQEILAQANRA